MVSGPEEVAFGWIGLAPVPANIFFGSLREIGRGRSGGPRPCRLPVAGPLKERGIDVPDIEYSSGMLQFIRQESQACVGPLHLQAVVTTRA